MNKDLEKMIEKVKQCFPKSFVSDSEEIIFDPKNNVYFRLESIETELDFKCKMMAWLSRPISKSLNLSDSKRTLKGFNAILESNFSKSEIEMIYTYLGNDVNRELSREFIESGYNLKILSN